MDRRTALLLLAGAVAGCKRRPAVEEVPDLRARLRRALVPTPSKVTEFRDAFFDALKTSGRWNDRFDAILEETQLGEIKNDGIPWAELSPAARRHLVEALDRDLTLAAWDDDGTWVGFFTGSVARLTVEAGISRFEEERRAAPDAAVKRLVAWLQAHSSAREPLPAHALPDAERICLLIDRFRAQDQGGAAGHAAEHAAGLLRELSKGDAFVDARGSNSTLK